MLKFHNQHNFALLAINHGGQEGFAVPIQLFCIYVYAQARFQLDRVMVLINVSVKPPRV